MTGKSHFTQRRKQASIGPVMISKYFIFMIQVLYGSEKALEFLHSLQTRYVRRIISNLLINLSQRRPAKAVSASTHIDQNEFCLTTIRTQLRRKRFTRIRYSCKRGNDQRQWRSDFFSDSRSAVIRFPYSLHRHGILAHRDADA